MGEKVSDSYFGQGASDGCCACDSYEQARQQGADRNGCRKGNGCVIIKGISGGVKVG